MDRLTIPSLPDASLGAADIVIGELRRLGMDPRLAAKNIMAREVCIAWSRGEMTDAQFRRAIGNLLILNPGLASDIRCG